MSSKEKKADSNGKSSEEIEKENEDPGLVQFKEETSQRYLMNKILELPEVNCCTYKQGYISQECYSCLTCF